MENVKAENQVVSYVEGSLGKGMVETGCFKGREIALRQHSST